MSHSPEYELHYRKSQPMTKDYSSAPTFDDEKVPEQVNTKLLHQIHAAGTTYDRGSRVKTLAGLVATLLVGVILLASGIGVYVYPGTEANTYTGTLIDMDGGGTLDTRGNRIVLVPFGHPARLFLNFLLTAIVTACTDATGYVHSTTLKWALAREGRLRFNANLRLFTAARGTFTMNGWIANVALTLLLLLSYVAASGVWGTWACGNPNDLSADVYQPIISWAPLALLGAALTLQAVHALIALSKTTVPTWTSNLLDTAAALIQFEYLNRVPDRCMRSVADADSTATNPVPPYDKQPSAWASHSSVRRVVGIVWGLVVAEFVWFGVMAYKYPFTTPPDPDFGPGTPTPFMEVGTNGVGYSFKSSESMVGLKAIFIIGSIQTVLTLGLNCCELVTTLSRDEGVWRAASSAGGARDGRDPTTTALGSWQSLGLTVAKPVLHWIFSNAASFTVNEGVAMLNAWVLILAVSLIPLAAFVTFIATRRPLGPQPATYGHIQTLVNAVDEGSLTMYWGHKSDGPPAHAGTSSEVLPPVDMNMLYAGYKKLE